MEIPSYSAQHNATWSKFLKDATEALGEESSVKVVPTGRPEDNVTISRASNGAIVENLEVLGKDGRTKICMVRSVVPHLKSGYVVGLLVASGIPGPTGLAVDFVHQAIEHSKADQEAQQLGRSTKFLYTEAESATKRTPDSSNFEGRPRWDTDDGSVTRHDYQHLDGRPYSSLTWAAADGPARIAKFSSEDRYFVTDAFGQEFKVHELDGRFVMTQEPAEDDPASLKVQAALEEVRNQLGP